MLPAKPDGGFIQNEKRQPGMNKILAKDEVVALLRGLSGGDIEAGTDEPVDDSGIVAFDLANQERIIRGRMPVLEIVNDRFARLCTNAL